VIIVDTALAAREAEGRPVRVGIVGAGFMAQGLTNQIENSVPGMRVVAISNRKPQRAADVFRYSGVEATAVESQTEFEDVVRAGGAAYTDDPFLLCRSEQVDVVCEVTGSVELGAQVALEAFAHGKDVVLMNAELEATIGPILNVHADRHGVIMSACDGDEPGVQLNLYRWVKGLGLQPRVIGNVKGLQDPYRNPTTQKEFAEKWEQNPAMVTSFADGFTVLERGMSRGLEYRDDVMTIGRLYDVERIRELGGIIDYVVGTPLTKVYVLAEHDDPKQQHYLSLYKMGDGPLYSFFVPYHLVHFEVPNAIGRVALLRDPVSRALGGPVVEVCALAKRDLKAGETLDDYGEYMTYGEAASVEEMSAGRYLPEGLVLGCVLRRDILRDQVITYDDVELPSDRLADRLRAEQYEHFRGETWLSERVGAATAV
jgi:predicted homoserine dehydrogenase-like protein